MPNFLTQAEIASVREDTFDLALDMTCDIERNTPGAPDSHNQPTPGVWAVIANDVRCHYWEEDEAELIGQPNATTTRERVLLPANTDARTDDRVMRVVGIDGAQVATDLDIREVLSREFDTLLQVRAIK